MSGFNGLSSLNIPPPLPLLALFSQRYAIVSELTTAGSKNNNKNYNNDCAENATRLLHALSDVKYKGYENTCKGSYSCINKKKQTNQEHTHTYSCTHTHTQDRKSVV